jgi:hypothetical protein
LPIIKQSLYKKQSIVKKYDNIENSKNEKIDRKAVLIIIWRLKLKISTRQVKKIKIKYKKIYRFLVKKS